VVRSASRERLTSSNDPEEVAGDRSQESECGREFTTKVGRTRRRGRWEESVSGHQLSVIGIGCRCRESQSAGRVPLQDGYRVQP
jgi:hypothetical protein